MKQSTGPKSPGTRSPSRHEHYKKLLEGIKYNARYERRHPKPDAPPAPAPTMKKAKPKPAMSPWKTATVMKPCPACNGSGSVPKKWLTFLTSPCERCGGRGEIKTVDRIPRGSDKMYRHRENLKNAKA